MVVLVWNSLNGSDSERINTKKTLATRKKKIDRRRFNVLSNIEYEDKQKSGANIPR